MRQKHPKKQFSTKFTDEAIWTIDELSDQWDCTKTEAIERALMMAKAIVEDGGSIPVRGRTPDVQADPSQGMSLESLRAVVPLVNPAPPVRERWQDRVKREAEENLAKRASEDKLAREMGRDDIEYDHNY